MTRGKEVQDFIKENKKTARERFIEAGYSFGFDYYGRIIYAISKVNNNKIVMFDLEDREYSVRFNDDATYVDAKLHKLITYQLEELGWL